MIQYEKIELDYQLPIKLLDIYFEDHHTKTAKHYHNSIEILIPVLGKLKLFLTDKELIIPQGSLIYRLIKLLMQFSEFFYFFVQKKRIFLSSR